MLRACLIMLLACGTLTGAALSARTAGPAEARQIAAGARPFIVANSAPGLAFTVRRVTVSTRNRAWARLDLYSAQAGPATAVARRTAGRWRGVSLGSDGVGCAIPSAAVRADLKLPCVE